MNWRVKMNKIKVIDLLNMISKGEEVPKKIKYRGEIAEYDEELFDYWIENLFKDTGYLFEGIFVNYGNKLNDEVEIIEEEKEIEKINIISDTLIAFDDKYQDINIGGCTPTQIAFATKINEIIDVINDMRDKEC
jgi:hypothetical protein